jgi:hypothetical protein
VRTQERQANDLAANYCFDQIMDQQYIAQRLRHLGAVDAKESVMYPKARERFAIMHAGTLREFVFMMREDQVLPTSMNIDRAAEMRG